MELFVKRFEELTAGELYEILRLRVSVFVVEQQCPYQEIDGLDSQSIHVWLSDAGQIQAYLRIVDRGKPGEAWLGRVIAVDVYKRQALQKRNFRAYSRTAFFADSAKDL